MFSSEIEDTQENCIRRALFGLDDNIVLRAETKTFNIKKKVDRYLKHKNNDPCKIYGCTVINHVILLVTNLIMLVEIKLL